MIKIIKNAKHDFKMFLFVILHDSNYKHTLKLISIPTGTLIAIIWFFDFPKLEPLLKISTEAQTLIRTWAIILLFEIFLFSCFFLNLHFYKKYNRPHKLNKEELDKFNKYFNIPKKEPRITWI